MKIKMSSIECWIQKYGLKSWISVIVFMSLVPQASSQSVRVTLGPIREEQRTGTYVGNIASASAISRDVSQAEFSTLRFDFLNPSDRDTHLFSLNGRSGALFTQTMIDREDLCEDLDECLIKFDVTVNSEVTDFLRLVEVSINVTDINDNIPTFEEEEITIDIPENNAVGLTQPLPSAVDKDKGENSVQKYTLIAPHEPFSLNVERRLKNKFVLSLVLSEALDRERQDRYKMLLTASDGGHQAMTGTLTVNINVTDLNDNSPEFTQNEYSYSVVETAGVGEVLGKLTATDKDAGKNADIRYSLIFSGKDHRGRSLFDVDQFTGEITIKAPLQDEAGKTFEAVVEARDQGDVPRTSEATMTLTVVNVINNAPRLEVTLQKTVYENTVLLSEDSKNSTFVGKLTATDSDPGTSGIVTCYSTHPSFKTIHNGGYYFILMNGSLDREVAERFDVTLVCHDAGSPPKTSSVTFHVIVADVNDNAPVFSQTQYVVNITEENIVGQQILKLMAEDPDAGTNKAFTYSLFPRENSVFSIDRDSGILKARTTFDHEVEKRLNVIVLATDEGNPSLVSTATVIVNILDINDNYPEIVTRELSIPEGRGNMRYVGKLEGSDKDSGLNADLVFSMPLTNDITGQMFKVNPNGVVIALQELDREMQDKYILSLEVRDKGLDPKTKSGTVTVVVEDVNDNSPVFQFPNQKNHTVTLLWSTPVNKEITRVTATDLDLGENKTVSYNIHPEYKGDLFRVDRSSGALFLQRKIRDTDGHFHKLTITAHDWGAEPQESHTFLNVIIDVTNATFSALDDRAEEEKYILLAGIVVGVTVLFSAIALVIIFLIRRGGNRRSSTNGDKHIEWQVVKTGIQEECGKGEVEKAVAWRGSDVDIKDLDDRGPGGRYLPPSDMDITKTGSDDTFKKSLDGSTSCKDGCLQGHGTLGVIPDSFRKHDFYTLCKVRVNPHDDVNSVTSGETTTSDSGRGGSEDDMPLPPIPELYGDHNSPKHVVEYRPITSVPSSSANRYPMKSDFRTMPSLTSFRSPDVRLYPVTASQPQYSETSFNQGNPYNSDTLHSSPRSGGLHSSSAKQGPPRKPVVSSRGQATLPPGKPRIPYQYREDANHHDPNRRSPFQTAYEKLVPESGTLYTCTSPGENVDEEDGNTTTSGSYTISSDNLNDSFISA